MKYFSSAREAKEFLATQIIHEATIEGISLSEVEQKMLYFTETGRAHPNMIEIAAKFDEEYDQKEYEAKMGNLARSAAKRAKRSSGDEYERWLDAVRFLSTEDHYISVIVGRPRPRFDLLKLWGTGFAAVGLFLVVIFLSVKFNLDFSKYFPSRDAFQGFVWGTAACLAALYVIARLIFGSRADDWVTDVMMKVFGGPDLKKRSEAKTDDRTRFPITTRNKRSWVILIVREVR